MKKENNKGITLIALVITIIVMLILVVVTINVATEGGLIKKANQANKETEAKVDEESKLTSKEMEEKIDIIVNGGDSNPPATYVGVTGLTANGVTAVSYNDLKTYDSSLGTQLRTGADGGKIVAVIKEGENLAPIPKGFTVSSKDTEQKISTGLVIYEGEDTVNVSTDTKTKNQFVWVPVKDVVKEKDISATYKPMVKLQSGSTENYEGVLYNFSGTTSTEKSRYGLSTNEDSTPSYREPVILDDPTNAPDSSNGITESLMQSTFNSMVKSIQKYGGFYVGRYEATNMNGNKATVIAGTQTGISSLDWYTMYNSMYQETDAVQSEMIWGCEWDAMLNWMLKGTQASKVTATSNGNHSYRLRNTGVTSTDVINNVYDLEGNVREWTQEAVYTGGRVFRGGIYYISFSPADRDYCYPTYGDDRHVGSRATLYIK